MSKAVFEKHSFQNQEKRKISLTEEFDPRPLECRGNAKSLLPAFLDSVRNESLGVSLLLDSRFCHPIDVPMGLPSVPEIAKLKSTIAAFKESLKLPSDKLRQIEQSTRDQRHSDMWFSARRYRITASRFGDILHRRSTTPPDALVLSILQPKSFSSPATNWGVQKEPLAIEAYITYQHEQGKAGLTVGPCGIIVSESYPFLGATPDGTVYDPTFTGQPFGFIEVKCPFSHRHQTPLEASNSSSFFCNVQLSNNAEVIRLRQSHKYYAQVQGQMAVGDRKWCDFVVFTTKGISVERINYDEEYWMNTLLPKLEEFYDTCLAPEIVSPIHALGLPLRDLSKIVQ